MSYEYEQDVISELEQMGVDYQSNGYFNMSIEVEEVYRKARAFDEIMKGELGAYYDKAQAFDEIESIFNNYFENYGCYPSPKEYVQEVVSIIDNYKERADDER